MRFGDGLTLGQMRGLLDSIAELLVRDMREASIRESRSEPVEIHVQGRATESPRLDQALASHRHPGGHLAMPIHVQASPEAQK